MTRRHFLSVAQGSLAAGMAHSYSDAAQKTMPNVLFIAVDDLNDWLGCLGGHPQARTPNLDRLASSGLLFERAYCAAPWCNPSRTALLTGLRPSTTGVYASKDDWRAMIPNPQTLPSRFMGGGYHVVGGGKIFHGGYEDANSWHEWWGVPKGSAPQKVPVSTVDFSAATGNLDFGPLDVPDEKMRDYKIAQQAVDYLKKEHDRPFFLGCGLMLPHLPWYAPRKYFDQHPVADIVLPIIKEDDLDDVPQIARKWVTGSPGDPPDAPIRARGDHYGITSTDNWPRAVQAYLASISFMDACLGHVMTALSESRYANDTIVVLWGDHGWHLGEKLAWRKTKLWEESTRVPLIFRVPGVTQPGGRCRRTVSLMDVYPTLLDLCGLPPNKRAEGTTLRPLLANPRDARDRPAVTTHLEGNHSVRSEKWRYTRYADGEEELYFHDFDPLEWRNLASNPQFADVKTELARWLPKNPSE